MRKLRQIFTLGFQDCRKVIIQNLFNQFEKSLFKSLNVSNSLSVLFRAWDVYLIPPTKSKRLRSTVELMKFVIANPTVPIDARYSFTSVYGKSFYYTIVYRYKIRNWVFIGIWISLGVSTSRQIEIENVLSVETNFWKPSRFSRR